MSYGILLGVGGIAYAIYCGRARAYTYVVRGSGSRCKRVIAFYIYVQIISKLCMLQPLVSMAMTDRARCFDSLSKPYQNIIMCGCITSYCGSAF